MARSYEHSNTFAALKGIRETLQGNLSTVQYMRILDAFLLAAVEPLISDTNYVDTKLVEVLAWSTVHSRRRLVMDKTTDYRALIFQFVATSRKDKDRRLSIWKELKLDRAVGLYIVSKFLEDTQREFLPAANLELVPANEVTDPVAYNNYVIQKIEELWGCTTPLMQLYNQVRFWEGKTRHWKKVILEKYVRLCLTTAQRDYKGFFNLSIDLSRIIQVYLFMANRAIDRCDSDQGTLTTLVMNWFMTAKTKLHKERVRDLNDVQANLVPLDLFASETETVTDGEFSAVTDALTLGNESSEHFNELATIADPVGWGRYLLGIEQDLTRGDQRVFDLLKTQL